MGKDGWLSAIDIDIRIFERKGCVQRKGFEG